MSVHITRPSDSLSCVYSEFQHSVLHIDIVLINRQKNNSIQYHSDVDDDQWRYSPDRALASLYGFHDS
jgi:hypothetical protein